MKMLSKLYCAAGELATRTMFALPLMVTSGNVRGAPLPSMTTSSPLIVHVAADAAPENGKPRFAQTLPLFKSTGGSVENCGTTGGLYTTPLGKLEMAPVT